MHYLIYTSRSTYLIPDNELIELLTLIRERNQAAGITGMLLYRDHTFMQVLEGKKQTLVNLYRKILHDKRHNNITLLAMAPLEKRNFPDWSMGFNCMRWLLKANVQGLSPVMKGDLDKDLPPENQHLTVQLPRAFARLHNNVGEDTYMDLLRHNS